MRTDPLATCEQKFILQTFVDGRRVDGRLNDEFRPVKLVLGSEPGTALATVGSTKVLCIVSASLSEPSKSRPAKGVINVEVDLSPMGSPAHESGRLGERGIELTRLLELIIRDSSCVDMEALCIRAGKLVWKIRLDVRVIDDAGALVDCATIAAAAALQHFRRPDVTVQTQNVIVHSKFERPLIPLNIYHQPICVTFAFAHNASVVVLDPNERETLCVEGCLLIACNRRREVCALHQSAHLTLSTKQIRECIAKAMQRAVDLGELVAAVVGDDRDRRARYQPVLGFDQLINIDFLNSREAHPNELIAPAVEVSLSKGADALIERSTRASLIIQGNPITDSAVSSQNGEEAAVTEITTQVTSIIDAVKSLDTDTEEATTSVTPTRTPTSKKQKESVKNRKRDVEEMNDFLDDLDGGDTVELPGSAANADEEIDLLSAVRKKKKTK